jgi:hypothetical protein
VPRGYSGYASHDHAQYLRQCSFMLSQKMTQQDRVSGGVVGKVAALVTDSAEIVAWVAKVERS